MQALPTVHPVLQFAAQAAVTGDAAIPVPDATGIKNTATPKKSIRLIPTSDTPVRS